VIPFRLRFRKGLAAALGLAFVTALNVTPVSAESVLDESHPLPRPKPVRDTKPAKRLFGAQAFPAKLPAKSHGFYSKGCLAGGEMLEQDGPAWQVMRLSRNRNWGHPELIAYIKRLAVDAKRLDGWPGLLVGDLAQPRGGPMLTGHASHQIGLDADIWMLPSPNRQYSLKERENVSSISMIKGRYKLNNKTWTEGHGKLLRRAASYPEVARIFVHAVIKKQLCEWATGDRSWLQKIRPWYGHHYHFHVRLSCPDDNPGCRNQKPAPPGDGCGAELAHWLKPQPKPKKPAKKVKPPKKKPPITLSALPKACRTVLNAE
jgi:penicillin-insensitive murein endopeptidase